MSSAASSYFVPMMIDYKEINLGPSTSSTHNRPFPMLHLLFNLLLLLLPPSFFFASPCHAACNQNDRDSLLAFLSNTTFPSSSPLNWSTSIDCCSWEGVVCVASDDDRVTQLWLPSRGLTGHLSSSLLNLSLLTHLNLSHNRFTGSLPTGFFPPLIFSKLLISATTASLVIVNWLWISFQMIITISAPSKQLIFPAIASMEPSNLIHFFRQPGI